MGESFQLKSHTVFNIHKVVPYFLTITTIQIISLLLYAVTFIFLSYKFCRYKSQENQQQDSKDIKDPVESDIERKIQQRRQEIKQKFEKKNEKNIDLSSKLQKITPQKRNFGSLQNLDDVEDEKQNKKLASNGHHNYLCSFTIVVFIIYALMVYRHYNMSSMSDISIYTIYSTKGLLNIYLYMMTLLYLPHQVQEDDEKNYQIEDTNQSTIQKENEQIIKDLYEDIEGTPDKQSTSCKTGDSAEKTEEEQNNEELEAKKKLAWEQIQKSMQEEIKDDEDMDDDDSPGARDSPKGADSDFSDKDSPNFDKKDIEDRNAYLYEDEDEEDDENYKKEENQNQNKGKENNNDDQNDSEEDDTS